MTTATIWISVEAAIIAERREDVGGRGHVALALTLLPRGGDETLEAFCFRVLDAVHHARSITVLGPDGARVRLKQRAEMYAFLAARIEGVHFEPDGTAVAAYLDSALLAEDPDGRDAAAAEERGTASAIREVSSLSTLAPAAMMMLSGQALMGGEVHRCNGMARRPVGRLCDVHDAQDSSHDHGNARLLLPGASR